MFKLIRDAVKKKIARHSLMIMKVDIEYLDVIVTYKYKNLSVVQSRGKSHLCYDYVTENTEFVTGIVIGTALKNIPLGMLLCDDSESAYCDLLTGERVYPDEGSDLNYLGSILEIKQEDFEKGRMRIQSGDISKLLKEYDIEKRNIRLSSIRVSRGR